MSALLSSYPLHPSLYCVLDLFRGCLGKHSLRRSNRGVSDVIAAVGFLNLFVISSLD